MSMFYFLKFSQIITRDTISVHVFFFFFFNLFYLSSSILIIKNVCYYAEDRSLSQETEQKYTCTLHEASMRCQPLTCGIVFLWALCVCYRCPLLRCSAVDRRDQGLVNMVLNKSSRFPGVLYLKQLLYWGYLDVFVNVMNLKMQQILEIRGFLRGEVAWKCTLTQRHTKPYTQFVSLLSVSSKFYWDIIDKLCRFKGTILWFDKDVYWGMSPHKRLVNTSFPSHS